MTERLRPSDNPVATALAIAYEITAGRDYDSPAARAAEINELIKAMVKGFRIAEMHGS